MRLLFHMDNRDYAPNSKQFIRPSVRGIIIRGDRVAMVYSQKYNYYKFPGGGIEPGESQVDTLIREVSEEAGLQVFPETIREYGLVHRVDKSDQTDGIFVQDNYYYLCDADAGVQPQHLDDYEQEEGFTLMFVEPAIAISANRTQAHGPKAQGMLEREALVLEQLMAEGFLPQC